MKWNEHKPTMYSTQLNAAFIHIFLCFIFWTSFCAVCVCAVLTYARLLLNCRINRTHTYNWWHKSTACLSTNKTKYCRLELKIFFSVFFFVFLLLARYRVSRFAVRRFVISIFIIRCLLHFFKKYVVGSLSRSLFISRAQCKMCSVYFQQTAITASNYVSFYLKRVEFEKKRLQINVTMSTQHTPHKHFYSEKELEMSERWEFRERASEKRAHIILKKPYFLLLDRHMNDYRAVITGFGFSLRSSVWFRAVFVVQSLVRSQYILFLLFFSHFISFQMHVNILWTQLEKHEKEINK